MQKSYTDPCERCGKELTVSRSWDEKVQIYGGESTVSYTESVCPDEDCQKHVDAERAKVREKMEKNKKDREERALAFQENKKNRSQDNL